MPDEEAGLAAASQEQDSQPETPPVVTPDPAASPQPEKTPVSDTSPRSPVRPSVNDTPSPQERLTPSPPVRGAPRSMSPREQMQRAEEALIDLRQKMSKVAADFAEGKLNPAQFDAIYARYSEQRAITEQLLARNPDSEAWQSVIRPGHTSFLLDHFEARVMAYAIYDQSTSEQIAATGSLQIKQEHITAVLKRLQTLLIEQGKNPGPAKRQMADGRCVIFVPGEFSVAVAILSLEPSAAQIKRIQDIHRDFERANQQALRTRDFGTGRLVYPHRALFEERK